MHYLLYRAVGDLKLCQTRLSSSPKLGCQQFFFFKPMMSCCKRRAAPTRILSDRAIQWRFIHAVRLVVLLLRVRKKWAKTGQLLKDFAPVFNHVHRRDGILKAKKRQ